MVALMALMQFISPCLFDACESESSISMQWNLYPSFMGNSVGSKSCSRPRTPLCRSPAVPTTIYGRKYLKSWCGKKY